MNEKNLESQEFFLGFNLQHMIVNDWDRDHDYAVGEWSPREGCQERISGPALAVRKECWSTARQAGRSFPFNNSPPLDQLCQKKWNMSWSAKGSLKSVKRWVLSWPGVHRLRALEGATLGLTGQPITCLGVSWKSVSPKVMQENDPQIIATGKFHEWKESGKSGILLGNMLNPKKCIGEKVSRIPINVFSKMQK